MGEAVPMGTGLASKVLFRTQLTGVCISLWSLTILSSMIFPPKMKGEKEGIKHKMDIGLSQPHQMKDVPERSYILDQMS